MGASDAANDGKPETAEAKRSRFVSTIDFPYSDLDSAIELARTVHAHGTCETAQLATWMNQSAEGGTFKSRVSAARLFGLVQQERGQIALTALGVDITDSTKERAARVAAFLNVPLYVSLYDQYKGYALPPPPAIERQVETLGVSPKQKARARQTFMKSAVQANFIDAGSGRLIKPSVGTADPSPPPPPPKKEDEFKGGNGGDGGNGDSTIDPIIRGLLVRLPKSGDVWPETDRKLWLQLLEGSFKLIYKDKSALALHEDQQFKPGEHVSDTGLYEAIHQGHTPAAEQTLIEFTKGQRFLSCKECSGGGVRYVPM